LKITITLAQLQIPLYKFQSQFHNYNYLDKLYKLQLKYNYNIVIDPLLLVTMIRLVS